MGRRRRDDPDRLGVLLVDKPPGPTSHDVVAWVRWGLGVQRVGHCGTLDPAATGLMVVAVGAATKLVPYLTGQDKVYRARFVLGRSTTTGDADGETVAAQPCPPDTQTRAREALMSLLGAQSLPPPAFSAVRIDGVRAHALARAGQAPELAPRPMHVHAIDEVVVRRGAGSPDGPTQDPDAVVLEATLRVSKGTYVRSLAEALGARLGLPAHLGALHRLHSGALSLDDDRAVCGVTARRLPVEPAPSDRDPDRDRDPERPGRPPRWRLSLALDDAGPTDDDGARMALRAHLMAHLLDPADAVPLPLWRVTDDESGERALHRIAAGQALAATDPGLQPPAHMSALRDGEAVAVAAAAGGRGLVVARWHAAPPGLRPERVVVPPQRPAEHP